MEVKKRNGEIVVFDTEKIAKAIVKAMKAVDENDSDNDIKIMTSEILEKIMAEDNIQVGDSAKAWAINTIIRFIRSKLIRNYMLLLNKLYNIKLKVLNKENWYKVFRFISKHVVEIGLKEIIRMILVKLIDIIKKRRELNKTSFYYAYF